MKEVLLAVAALAILALPTGAFAQATATPGQAVKIALVPKFLGTDGISKLFDQTHEGAEQRPRSCRTPARCSSSGRPPGEPCRRAD